MGSGGVGGGLFGISSKSQRFFFFPEKPAKMSDFKISCEESCVFFSLLKLFLCLFVRLFIQKMLNPI